MWGIPSVGRNTRSCDWNHRDVQVCTHSIVVLRVTRLCAGDHRLPITDGIPWSRLMMPAVNRRASDESKNEITESCGPSGSLRWHLKEEKENPSCLHALW